MPIIVPSILTNDAGKYRQFVEAYRSFAQRVQVDISDQTMTQNETIEEGGIWWPSGWLVDVHMMVARPSEHVNTLIKVKPHMVIFHAEVEEDLNMSFIKLREAGIKAGIAFLKTSFPGRFRDYIRAVDHVMLFSGNLGSYGGEADMLQLEKIEVIRGIREDIEIGWDGGANMMNVWEIAQAGVNVINVGSAIAGAERPREVFDIMMAQANRGNELQSS